MRVPSLDWSNPEMAMGELGALILYLIALSEPTLQVVVPAGDLARMEQRGASLGFGLRWRIGIAEHHAVRLRLDRFAFHLKSPVAGEDLEQVRTAYGVEFLWRGRGLNPGFYAGGGLDLVKSRLYKEVPQLISSEYDPLPHMGMVPSDIATTQSLGAGATAGYAFKAGSGLLLTESHVSWAKGPTGHSEVVFTASLGYRWMPKQ
jgi:hypothetical protein